MLLFDLFPFKVDVKATLGNIFVELLDAVVGILLCIGVSVKLGLLALLTDGLLQILVLTENKHVLVVVALEEVVYLLA